MMEAKSLAVKRAEVEYTIPCATVAPAEPMEPPVAVRPLTVLNCCAVLYSHRRRPSNALNARHAVQPSRKDHVGNQSYGGCFAAMSLHRVGLG